MSAAIESTGAALADLVEALRATNWSSWQTTARFDPALQAAEATLAHERVRDAAPDLLATVRMLLTAIENIGGEHVTGMEHMDTTLEAAYGVIAEATGATQ